MEVVGYILGILVGIVLGLFGAGGAIISFPILVYFMNIPPVEAGPYSLIIVGISAIAGLYAHLKNKHIDIKVSLLFSIPMIFSFYIFKYWLLPLLPFTISNFRTMNITINHVMLLLFLIVMSVLVYRMFNASQSDKDETPNSSANNTLKYILYSSLVGILAASIGAGGGFIIVPALVDVFHLPIKKATGTSLFIISINAIIGTLMNIKQISLQYFEIVAIFSFLAIVGIFIGSWLNNIIRSNTLRKTYAYFLLIVLLSTFFTEIYRNYQIIKHTQ